MRAAKINAVAGYKIDLGAGVKFQHRLARGVQTVKRERVPITGAGTSQILRGASKCIGPCFSQLEHTIALHNDEVSGAVCESANVGTATGFVVDNGIAGLQII